MNLFISRERANREAEQALIFGKASGTNIYQRTQREDDGSVSQGFEVALFDVNGTYFASL